MIREKIGGTFVHALIILNLTRKKSFGKESVRFCVLDMTCQAFIAKTVPVS